MNLLSALKAPSIPSLWCYHWTQFSILEYNSGKRTISSPQKSHASTCYGALFKYKSARICCWLSTLCSNVSFLDLREMCNINIYQAPLYCQNMHFWFQIAVKISSNCVNNRISTFVVSRKRAQMAFLQQLGKLTEYLINWLTATKDEIYGTFNVAILKVMTALNIP